MAIVNSSLTFKSLLDPAEYGETMPPLREAVTLMAFPRVMRMTIAPESKKYGMIL
jgi:hypothetical protein